LQILALLRGIGGVSLGFQIDPALCENPPVQSRTGEKAGDSLIKFGD
jgi:hypothetical protein